MKIILLGGTGFIGRHICEKLVRAGHDITVPTRKLENAREIQMLPRLQPVVCDVHQAAELASVAFGHDVLINLVAILHGSEAEFERVHVALPQSIVMACKAAGIKRIVQMSSLGAALGAPSQYLRSKGRGEQVFAQSGLDVNVLRPSVVFGEGDRLLNVFANLLRVFPFVPLAGSEAQFQPVWVEDVAQAVVQLISVNNYQEGSVRSHIGKGNSPKIYEITGNRVMSLRELFELAGRSIGVSRPIFHLPNGLAVVQAWVMEHLPGPTLMSRDNLTSMQSPNVASGQWPGLKDLGIEAASIELIAPRYLKQSNVLDNYRKRGSN